MEREDLNLMIRFWQKPTAEELGNGIKEFLEILGKPSILYFPGEDSSRCRVVSTLLHGNEPSGLNAIYHWIKSNPTAPAVDIYFFIASIETALGPPEFYFRHLPGHRDLNRCFRPPFDDHEGLLAKAFLEEIEKLQPEAVIDIHNTSGAGPAFAVSVIENEKHNAIASLFTHRLIVADVFLGALMEVAREDLPIVTIECGGVEDLHSEELAYDGLVSFITTDDLFSDATSHHFLERLIHPVRLEILSPYSLTYSQRLQKDFDFTIREDIEHFNFQTISSDTQLGWFSDNNLAIFRVVDGQGNDVLEDYFQIIDGTLFPRQTLKLFMATGRTEIAKSDCLFYVSKIRDVETPVIQST